MTIKDRFIEEARVGAYVELMAGPKELRGTIIALDAETVQIGGANGKRPVVSLDVISYYELSEAPDTGAPIKKPLPKQPGKLKESPAGDLEKKRGPHNQAGEGDPSAAGSSDDTIDFMEDTLGDTEISPYILQKIEKINLENELKEKSLVDKGIFNGTVEQALAIIKKRRKTKNVNNEIKGNNAFVIAKIIQQVLNRPGTLSSGNGIISKKGYQIHIAIGSFFYGNFRLYRTEFADAVDTARYFFLETVYMFQDAEEVDRCWAAATLRYMQTYYYTTDDIGEAEWENYVSEKNCEERCEEGLARLMKRKIQTTMKEFVLGMLDMLSLNTQARDSIIFHLYNHEKRNELIDILLSISEKALPPLMDEDTFWDLWKEAADEYNGKKKEFFRLVEDTIRSVFSVGQLQRNYDKLVASTFRDYLNDTDEAWFDDMLEIFSDLLNYNEISEFEYKVEKLGHAEKIRDRLAKNINDYPTYIGFEKFLPLLENLQKSIFKESSLLYGNAAPDIQVSLGDCSVNETDLTVLAPLILTNKKNVQLADNVSIRIEGEGVTVLNDDWQSCKYLLAGERNADGGMIVFEVTPEILEAQAFSVTVSLRYKYKKSLTEFQEACLEVPLSIPLYSQSTFQPIDGNKFELNRNGSVVKDVSMFYGRDKEIESILQQISDASGQVRRGRCLAIYGQKRTGKSSLLYHLKRRLREQDEEKNVIIDMKDLGNFAPESGISGFLYSLLATMEDEIYGKHHPALRQILQDGGIQIEADLLLKHPERAQLFFSDVFRKINRLLAAGNYKYNLIVMIDEFTYIYDWIRQGLMDAQFMKFWKAFVQNYGIFAIVVGQDHMMRFVSDERFTNAFGATDLRKVTYLPEEDAKRLMYEPILLIEADGKKVNRYKEEALDRLYELTAGSAYLIMNLCADLVKYLNETHSVYITKAHINDYLRKKLKEIDETSFDPQYDDKGPSNEAGNNHVPVSEANKRMLHRIARLSNKKEWAQVSHIARTAKERALLHALEQRDVVIVSEGERCKIKVALYKEWILEKYGTEDDNE